METLFDLPAHPMLVHAPVVFIPLLAIACVALSVRPGWRRHTPWLLGGGAITLVSVLVAMNSGEALDDAMTRADIGQNTARHQDLAETTRLFLFIAFLLLIAVTVLWWRKRTTAVTDTEGKATHAAWALASFFTVLAVVWAIRTGHEGAKLVWDGVLP